MVNSTNPWGEKNLRRKNVAITRSANNGFRRGLFKNNKILKKKKKRKKKATLHLCVCLSWFKETRGLHSVRRSRVPTSFDYSSLELL
jgi:hypothetical protein